MHDEELILEILNQIYDSTQKILQRFEPIKSVNDFTDTEAGMEKPDAICMQLIAIGEAIYTVCSDHVRILAQVTKQIMKEVQEN